MSVVKAIKFGFRWKIGDGKKIKFWEDTWFHTFPLAIQYRDTYILCNEQSATIAEVCDGVDLKLTFRRIFTPIMMEKVR